MFLSIPSTYLQVLNVPWKIYLTKVLYRGVNALLYSGVYDIKVLLWVKTTLGWLKILSNHSGNQTYDLRNASSALYRLSYVAGWFAISELGVVLSIPDSSKCIISRCKCIVLRCMWYYSATLSENHTRLVEITNRPDHVADSVGRKASIPEVVGSISTGWISNLRYPLNQ